MSHRPIKYPIKEGLFKTIDEQWKAYFLGWMFADGNMDQNARNMCININSSDREVLDFFVEKIYGGYRPLYDKAAHKTEGFTKNTLGKIYTSKPQLRFFVCSKPACLDMISHGLIPKKSLILKFPTEETVPNNLFFHFLRGYFEGDGYITATDIGKRYSVGILGTLHFLNGVQAMLEKHDIKSTIRTRSSVYVLNIARINDITKFANLIYQDAEFFLKRKKDTFNLIESNRHRSMCHNSGSRFIGVNFSKITKSFNARIMMNGKRHTLGSFPSEELAHQARLSFIKTNDSMYIEAI